MAVALLENPQIEVAVDALLDWNVERLQVIGGERNAHGVQQEDETRHGDQKHEGGHDDPAPHAV
jgi:hypothetical protein